MSRAQLLFLKLLNIYVFPEAMASLEGLQKTNEFQFKQVGSVGSPSLAILNPPMLW